MCETCNHSETGILTQVQLNQYDPTRTTTLRNAFARNMNKRFNELTSVIRKTVIERDCFGLNVQTNQMNTPEYRAFDFPRSADKIEAFMKWLKTQVDAGIIETREYQRIGSAIEDAWTNLYIYDSYKRGVMRARYEMKRAGYDVPTIEQSGGIQAVMGSPFHVDTLGVLYTRVFSDLKGITAAMDTQISHVLARGLADGDGPLLLARKLIATINGTGMGDLALTDEIGRFIPAKRRAEMLARTEIIRAHHMANIQEYKNWGVLGFNVISEFITAGDTRVCSQCAGYHGNRYTLEEAEWMIPVHPNCFIDSQTPIYTSEGWKPIGKIVVGDLVLTHKHRFRKVTSLIRTPKQSPEVVRFKFYNKLFVSMTVDHPVFVVKKGETAPKWVPAGEITKEDQIMSLTEDTYGSIPIPIKEIQRWRIKKPRTLYNFSVEEDESYIAKGVIVHNCRCIIIPVSKERNDRSYWDDLPAVRSGELPMLDDI